MNKSNLDHSILDSSRPPEEIKKELAEKYNLSEEQIEKVMRPKKDSAWRSTKKMFSAFKREMITGEKKLTEEEKILKQIEKIKKQEEEAKRAEEERLLAEEECK